MSEEMAINKVYDVIENHLLSFLSEETDLKKMDVSKFGLTFDFIYRFDEEYFSNLDCRIYRVANSSEKTVEYSFDFRDINYSNSDLEFDFIRVLGYNLNYKQKEIRSMLECIYDFRKNFKYSKLLDCFLPVVSFEEIESLELSKWILGHRNDECCVCYEKNKVFTYCGHNLCRVCFYKSKKNCCDIECEVCANDQENKCVLCPLCKQFLLHL